MFSLNELCSNTYLDGLPSFVAVKSLLMHALSCKKGGFISKCHDYV